MAMGCRLTFSLTVLILEVAVLVLFGFFVRYDEYLGMPTASNDTIPNSKIAIEKEAAVSEHISQFYAMFQDIHVMMFVGFGFLMTFLKRYGFGSVGLNFLVAAFVLQWATLVAGWVREFDQKTNTIYINLESMINAEFAAATILISFGAVLGKASPTQLIIMALFEVVVYEVNELIVFHYFHATDTGDSMVVHVFGAYFGLTVSRIIYKKNIEEAVEKNEASVYHSDLFSMIGTVFLWLFWPSFNAGTAVDEGRLRAIINTYYSLTASCIVSFAISSLVHKGKFNMIHIQNSTLAGGVAIGTVADLIIQPWAAILVGSVAAVVSVLGYSFLTPFLHHHLGLHDTCGVNNLHGMPGLMSGIGGILAAGLATQKLYGNGLAKIFTVDDRSKEMNAAYQAAALGVSLGMALVGGAITGLILRLPIWNQPEMEDGVMNDEETWLIPSDGFPSIRVEDHSHHDLKPTSSNASQASSNATDSKKAVEEAPWWSNHQGVDNLAMTEQL